MTVFADLLGVDVQQPLTISALEFDVLWEHLGLEDMPVVLRVDSPGGTNAERDRLVQAAWGSLENKGYGRSVDLDPRLTQMLRTLARPDSEVDGRLWLQSPVRVLVASVQDHAVHATLVDNKLTLREAALTGQPREALTVLPDKPAGPGSSVTLRSTIFEHAALSTSSPQQFAGALTAAGLRAADVESLRAMITDVGFQGQFGAAARDKWGARIRADHVVSFFDTAEGRYVQIRKPSSGGEDWTTLGPVDPRRMLQHVTAMFDEVRACAARR